MEGLGWFLGLSCGQLIVQVEQQGQANFFGKAIGIDSSLGKHQRQAYVSGGATDQPILK